MEDRLRSNGRYRGQLGTNWGSFGRRGSSQAAQVEVKWAQVEPRLRRVELKWAQDSPKWNRDGRTNGKYVGFLRFSAFRQ